MDDSPDDFTVQSVRPAGSVQLNEVQRCSKCALEVSEAITVCPRCGTAILNEPGTVLSEKYEFLSVSGWGGMSVIYKAQERGTPRVVAIKMLHSLLMTEQALKRFQQEAKAITSLRHPNIISVYDYGVSEHGQPYMVMDFIEGKNLGDVIKEKGALSLADSLPRFIQLCDALEHAHNVGVYHRDLKPTNIMISSVDGSFEDARIVDFGIAKLLDKSGEDQGSLTQTGELFGSPLYMSPEQCRSPTVDARTDIYSLGCVMYETLTGKPPFRGGTIVETIVMQMNDPPRSLSEAYPQGRFPEALESIIAKALAKDPDDRFQTMTELEFALMQIKPDQQTASHQNLRLKKPQKLTGLQPQNAIYAAIALSLIGLCLYGWSKLQENSTANQAPDSVTTAPEANAAANRGSIAPRELLLGLKRDHIDNVILETCLAADLGPMPLEKLSLEGASKITNRGLKEIYRVPGLKELELDRTRIDDQAMHYIKLIPNLQSLALRGTKITDQGLPELLEVSKLHSLYVSSTAVSDGGMATIGKMKALRNLTLTSTSIGDKGVAQLSHLRLAKLHLNYTNVTDDGLKSLKDMDSLEELELRGTKITNNGLAYLEGLSQLAEITVSSTYVNDQGLAHLEKCKNLEDFYGRSTDITDAGVKHFLKYPKLDTLVLERTKITDAALPVIAQMQWLERLTISNNPISDAGIAALTNVEQLRELELQGTNVTNAGLKRLRQMKHLEKLNLTDCKGVSLSAVEEFRKAMPKCNVIF